MTENATTLRQHVEREGIISFARFMELALYCPISGYYEQTGSQIGRSGDFFTNVSVGPLFGQLLAFQFDRWLEQAGGIDLVEAGAHDGQLAADILAWFREHRPGLFSDLRYHLVEPSRRRRDWQRAKLDNFAGTVRWVESLHQLGGANLRGVVFSNELLDAFPVHRLGWNASRQAWIEWGVSWAGDQYVWRRLPQDNAQHWDGELAAAGFDLPAELKSVLPDGYVLELCPAAAAWWREAARVLHRGWLLTFDYGRTAEEFLWPGQTDGTIRAYRGHRLCPEVLAEPGRQDITAHVNFTALQRAGEAEGLTTQGLSMQSQFLTALAALLWQAAPPSPAAAAQFRTLTHPEHLGRSFRVLIQARA